MLKKIIILLIIAIIVSAVGYNVYKRLFPIPVPDEIIIYKDGIQAKVNKNSSQYKKIVKLTNKRFNSGISTATDMVNDKSVLQEKNDLLGIEFIYNSEHELSIWGWGDGFEPFKYHRLFFFVNK